jgi:hypothetical protein
MFYFQEAGDEWSYKKPGIIGTRRALYSNDTVFVG